MTTVATETPKPVAPVNVDDLINGYKAPEKEVQKEVKKEVKTEVKLISNEEDNDKDLKSDESEKPRGKTESSIETSGEQKEKETQTEAKQVEKEEIKPEVAETEAKLTSKDAETDDYGNEIPKSRTYTEEEVNQMMRDRFKRGTYAQQAQQPATQQQVQQAAQGFTPDNANPDSWEVQLDQYIDRRLEQREKQQKTVEWQRQENERQVDFQAKFTSGMEKYKDFREVAAKLPITDSMLLATREMKDPAAFVYAAAKFHPEEVKRISNMTDAFAQAAEIGRLEERMRKSKNITRTAAPLQNITSDVSEKVAPKYTIDHMITNHAKRKATR